jgi:hypothetical protein
MKRPKFTRARFLRASSLAAIGWALILQASLASAQVVDPPSYEDNLAPGQSNDIFKTVQTPPLPPRPDIVFLADTTAGMGPAIANVQANAAAIMAAVDAGTSGIPFFAAAEYRDVGDSPLFAVNIGLTPVQADVNTAIGTWSADGGVDEPECQLFALEQLAIGTVSYRENATPVIVWFGDASGHDPCNGSTEASATAALVAGGIIVIAVGVTGADGLDATGQATRITDATGGDYIPGATPDQVALAILAGLSNLPITVIPTPVLCNPLVVTFDPTSDTVTSGDDAHFTETIAVPDDSALAGQDVHCTVEFHDENGSFLGEQLIWINIPLAIDLSPDQETNELSEDNAHTVTAHVTSIDVDLAGKTVNFLVGGTNAGTANPGGGTGTSPTDANGEATFSYDVPVNCDSLGTDFILGCTDRADLGEECDEVSKNWVDTIAPVAQCVETENPHGNNKPKAPGNGDQGQNQDGFYELLATDNLVAGCEPLELWVIDDGSGVDFGPFPVDTKIKYTQDPDAVPEITPMGGNNGDGNGQGIDVDWHIIGNGDALLVAVDESGNASDPVSCLVPPPPQ